MDGLLTYLHHTWILTLSELREFAGTRRSVVGIALYLLTFVVAAYYLVSMQRELGGGITLIRSSLSEHQISNNLEQFGLVRINDLFKYLTGQPSGVWLFQLIGVAWYPIFVILLSFDAVASEVNRGTPRFVIQRASRASYLSSKFFSHIILYSMLHISAGLILFLAYLFWLPHAHVLLPLVKFSVLMLGYIGLLSSSTIFISSFSSSAGKALIWIHVFWILCAIAGIFVPILNPLQGEWMAALMMPEGDFAARALIGFSAWSIGLMIVALIFWEWREL